MPRVNSLPFIWAVSLIIHAPLYAQFLLIPSSGAQPGAIRFFTPAGNEITPLQPVTFDPVVTVIVNQSLLTGPQKPALNNGLLSILPKAGAIQLELVSVRVHDRPQVVARNRLQFAAEIKKLYTAAQSDAAPLSFQALLDYLRTFPVPSAAWKQVVLVGPEPDVPTNLRDYAYGILVRTLTDRRIRLSQYHPDNASEPAWSSALRAAGGAVFSEDDPSTTIETSPAEWLEAKIPAWAPPAGFRVVPLELRTPGQDDPRVIPWIWSEAGKTLPEPAAYGEFQTLRAKISQAFAGNTPPPPETAADLTRLLAFNPYDLESLRLATDFADSIREYAAAAGHAARVVELEPANGPYFSRLGFYHWQRGDADNAERDLLRALELGADHPQSAAILGDIRWNKKDYPAAVEHYQEAVRREPERVELWLKLADTHQILGRKSDVALALEEALKRKPEMWDRRTQLIDYYLEAGDGNQAQRHVQSGIALLPADAALVIRFAAYSERLEQSGDAIRLWSRVIQLDGANESAYYSLARLQARAGAWDQVLAATETGMAAVSTSARLYALNVDALTALGRIDDARRVSRRAADRIPDQALFNRSAAFEDRYGADSPRYYKSLVEAMRSGGQPELAWRTAAERGLLASIREQQTTTCEWFAALLASKLCGPDAVVADALTVLVPGGFRALLFMAHGPQKSSDEAFLADYSRTLTDNLVGRDQKRAEAYREGLIEYFRLLSDLKGMGKAGSGKTLVRLSLEDKKSQRVTERVLALLGWRSRREAGKLVVEPATKQRRARRQDLASALAIDVVAMQEILQSGKEFVLEIPDERVEIFPEERLWQSQFYAGEHYTAGFLEAMVRNAAMASLYTALSNMEASSAALLVQSVGMKGLAEKYGRLLTLYSSCLQIAAGRVEVPGGVVAAPIWAALAKAPPNDPRRFLRTLLDKDDGRLLRFYFLLSQLDFTRQRFFTANQRRTESFYEVFRQSDQVEGKHSRSLEAASIEDLFRELPLDEAGRMQFPGGPEVWLVAKNKSSSVDSTERRVKKLARVTTPDVEDEILLRLIRNEYKQAGSHMGAWENFLAVVRVEAARPEPLNDAAALLLAEKYSANQGLYGYFTGLTALEAPHYREVFSFAEKMQRLDRRKSNIAAGMFQSVLYLLSAAEGAGRIAPPKTAVLLMDFAKAMNQAPLPTQWTRASLDFLRSYLDSAGVSRNSPSLRDVLLPTVTDQPIALADGHTVNPGAAMRSNYDRILELQKVPPLNDLLKVHTALIDIDSAKGDLRIAVNTLAETSKKFQDVEIPHQVKLPDSDMEMLKSIQLSQFAVLNRQLQKEATGKKIDPKRLQKLADEYWDVLAFRTTVALAGQIYAVNFRSQDLLVAEDPLFLRKQQFVVWGESSHEYFASGSLSVSSEAGGSRVVGGFDGISTVAGEAAARSLRNVDPTCSFVASALLGSIRAADWSRVNQASLRGVAVQIHAAQDWLVLAAMQPRLYEAVSISTYGLISLNRRARLLIALRRRDWDTVWSSLSLTDLFFLAGRLRKGKAQEGERSPAIDEYRTSAAGLPNGANELGPTLQHLRRRPTPGMVELAPYEDTAAERFPIYLAERVAEFKVYLVRLFAEQALPAAALPTVAEAAARAVLGDIQMTNYRDWSAVLDAYEEFDSARLQEVIGTL